MSEAEDYWNHNTAYHPELVRAAGRRGGRMLDVGCGDGLLLARLAPVATELVGIDTDPAAVERARERLAAVPHATVLHGDVLSSPALGAASFDVIVCVTTLHHLPLRVALTRLRELLAPGGRLLVVGLPRNESTLDWVLSGLSLVPIRIMGALHHEVADVGQVMSPTTQSLRQVREAARALLPGSRVRRRFYYRYTLSWTKPRSD